MQTGDFDSGEQFHNYILHSSKQQYGGVDLPSNLVEEMSAKDCRMKRYMR